VLPKPEDIGWQPRRGLQASHKGAGFEHELLTGREESDLELAEESLHEQMIVEERKEGQDRWGQAPGAAL
jgi:hypothetical protein